MKNISLILILSFVASSHSYAQTKSRSVQNNLIGSVHKIRVERAIFKCQQKECIEGERRGNTIEEYDAKGNLIVSNTTLFDPDNPLHRLYNYPFGDGPLLIEKSNFAPDGSFVGTDTFIYDNLLMQSEWIRHLKDGSIEQRTQYLFNYEGRMREAITYGSEQQVLGKTVYTYDEKGNEIERATYEEDNTVTEIVIFEYKFDGMGNWIKKVMAIKRPKNGELCLEPLAVCYRDITYH